MGKRDLEKASGKLSLLLLLTLDRPLLVSARLYTADLTIALVFFCFIKCDTKNELMLKKFKGLFFVMKGFIVNQYFIPILLSPILICI